MSLKDELLQELEESFRALQASYQGLSEEQMTRPWLGAWSIREILIHTAAWLREMTAAFERLAQGQKAIPEEIDYSDFDAWNAIFVEDRKLAPLADVLRELETHYRHYRQAAQALPEERWAPGRTAYRILHESGIDHFREHAQQIREWRQRAGL